ncbi:MAG: FliH/SctL family protein [Pseudomonadota bacterium]|nr:FliH/SctL family protein [Pseudomonadota bacterium]
MGEMMADTISNIVANTASEATIVPAERSANLMRWQIPSFDAPPALEGGLHTAAHLDEIESAAYQEGIQRGHVQGYAEGQRQAQQETERLRALIEHIQRPLAQLDEEIERAMLETACAIARRLTMAELSLRPELIETLVRTALAALPPYVREIRLRMNADDAAFIGSRPGMQANGQGFHIVADASLQRGDCRISTDSTQLDARLDTRLDAMRVVLAAENL